MKVTGVGLILQEEKAEVKRRSEGLDIARVLALMLVVYQHFSSNFEHLGLPVTLLGINSGQAGVASVVLGHQIEIKGVSLALSTSTLYFSCLLATTCCGNRRELHCQI